MEPLDVVVVGCVAVTRSGARLGKGGGFADLELGIFRELGWVTLDTPIVTTVHDRQVVDDDRLTMQRHDSALHWVVTPTEAIETHAPYRQPEGVYWDQIREDQYENIPFLADLRDRLRPP
jgi:5-formyltetrahydrofolate cyclo-ligase